MVSHAGAEGAATMMTLSDYDIIHAMKTYGGSFARALAEACRCADDVNLRHIKVAFPDLWREYRELASKVANALARAEDVCLMCGDKRRAHTKSTADWRIVAGCTGYYGTRETDASAR